MDAAIVKKSIFPHNPSLCKIRLIFVQADQILHVYGDLHWFPRDDKLQTPPGPEGSNGSSGFERRGVADVGRLHSLPDLDQKSLY